MNKEDFKPTTAYRYWLAFLVGLTGILLSLTAFFMVRELEQQRLQAEFTNQASNLGVLLEAHIMRDLQVVYSLGALYDAMGGIDRLTFRSFAQNALTRQPGIQALEWIPVVLQEQRPDYEAAARRAGFPDFQFTERNAQGELVRAAARLEYYPVYFVEPLAGNEPAVGFDLGSEAMRLQALRQARDSGKLAGSARIMLVQEKGQQAGFLAFVPIYRRQVVPATEAERRDQLVGYMLGVFRVGDMVDAGLRGLSYEGIRIELHDRSAPTQDSLLAHPGGAQSRPELRLSYPIAVGQRQWELLFYLTETYLAAQRSWNPVLLSVVVLLFSASLIIYLFVLQGRRAYAERLVIERTAALRESEEHYRSIFDNAVVGIFQSTPEGRYLSVNPAMARIFGYASPEEIVASINDIAHQIYVEASQRSIYQRLLQEHGFVKSFEAEAYCKDRSHIWISMEARCVRDAGGAVKFYEGTLVDITERKQIEMALQRAHDEAQSRVAWADRRTDELVSVITTLADGDFTQRAPVTEENDAFDVLAAGLNMLGAELAASTQALRDSEVKYRALVEHIPAVVYAVAPVKRPTTGAYVAVPGKTGSAIYVSPQIEMLLGYSPQEWLADPHLWSQRLHPQDCERVLQEYNRAGAQEDAFRCEYRLIARDGHAVWVLDEGHPIKDAAGQLSVRQGFMLDITERKQAEEALQQAHDELELRVQGRTAELTLRVQELALLQATVLEIAAPHDLPSLLRAIVERAARLLNTPGGGLYLCDPARHEARCVVSYNTLRDYTGLTLKYGEGAAGIVAQTGQPLIIDDYRVWSHRAAAYEEEQPFTAVLSAPMIWQGQVTGVIHVLHDRGKRAFTGADLELLTLFANHAALAVENARLYDAAQQEINERKRSEEELRASEERYRLLADNMSDLVWLTDMSLRTVYISPSVTRLRGFTLEEMNELPPDRLIAPDSRARAMQVLAENTTPERLAQTAEPITVMLELEFYKKDGSTFWSENTFTLIRDANGTPINILGAGRDITERRRAEEALHREQEFTHALLQSAADGVVACDANGMLALFNQTARAWHGMDARALPPEEWARHYDLYEPDGQTPLRTEAIPLARAFQGEQLRDVGMAIVAKGQTPRFVMVSGGPFFDAQGRKLGAVVVMRDITERKQLEEAERTARMLAEALRDTAAALSSTLDFDQVLERILANVHRVLPHDAANIMLIDASTGRVHVGRCRGYAERGIEEDAILARQFLAQDIPGFRHMLEAKQPLVVPDTRTDPDWRAWPDTRWINSYIGAPIQIRGEVVGFLNLDSATPGFFSVRHAARLQAFADQAALALENARLLAKLEQRVAERTEDLHHRIELEHILSTISTSFIKAKSADLDREINQALQAIGVVSGADRSHVFRFSQEGATMTNTHEWCAEGIEPQIGNLQALPVELFPWWMDKLRRFETICIPAVADLPAEANAEKEILQAQDILSLVTIPLVSDSTLIGFLGFDSVRTRKTWPEEDIALLKVAGEILVNAWRRRAFEEQSVSALREKEVLLRELHHRVKNNLQVIASLTNLQARSVIQQDTLDALAAMRDRVRSMALIHEKLYRSPNLVQVDFADYLESMARSLLQAYRVDRDAVTLRFDLERPISLDLNAAMLCGMIANELVSNSLKHAFPEGRGEIVIAFRAGSEGQHTLSVANNGVPLPLQYQTGQTAEVSAVPTFGLRLVQMLVEQLQGRLEVQVAPVVKFTVMFPRP
jgi:PAS domain S-box-containing protein